MGANGLVDDKTIAPQEWSRLASTAPVTEPIAWALSPVATSSGQRAAGSANTGSLIELLP